MTIILRMPPRILTPNGRPPHWAAKHRATKQARAQAKLNTLKALCGVKPPKPREYSLRYLWPTKRRLDDDNAIASVKAYMDGICEALRIDDASLKFRELIHASDKAKPRLEIILHLDP